MGGSNLCRGIGTKGASAPLGFSRIQKSSVHGIVPVVDPCCVLGSHATTKVKVAESTRHGSSCYGEDVVYSCSDSSSSSTPPLAKLPPPSPAEAPTTSAQGNHVGNILFPGPPQGAETQEPYTPVLDPQGAESQPPVLNPVESQEPHVDLLPSDDQYNQVKCNHGM